MRSAAQVVSLLLIGLMQFGSAVDDRSRAKYYRNRDQDRVDRFLLYTNNTSGFGNCAPQLSHLRGPGYYNWDISLQKNFQLTERFRLQFRSDFLNAFNTVNLAVPNTTVAQSTTGVINASQPARNIQFALKLYY